jgi:hypothetical protein
MLPAEFDLTARSNISSQKRKWSHICTYVHAGYTFFSLSPFPNCSFSFTALLTRMSCSRLRDTQGFGVQCASYIHCKVALIHVLWCNPRLHASPFPVKHLLARGYFPLSHIFTLYTLFSTAHEFVLSHHY